jgi:hypothetical protein
MDELEKARGALDQLDTLMPAEDWEDEDDDKESKT